jgi:hypothetical protein
VGHPRRWASIHQRPGQTARVCDPGIYARTPTLATRLAQKGVATIAPHA